VLRVPILMSTIKPESHYLVPQVEWNLWHSYDSAIRSCKNPAASHTMLDSIGKDECG
jgi:hypothetical protein